MAQQSEPKTPIETIAQAVQQATLSRSLSERPGQVVAALEGCMMEDAITPSIADVVKSLRMGGVSPFDADVAEIGRILRVRAAKIASLASRSRSKTHQSEIRTLAKRLQELRFRISTICVGSGEAQVVDAHVEDPGLEELLSGTVQLNFDTTGWDPARFAGKDVKVLMSGKFKVINQVKVEAPLLVKFPAGQGTVIFTSFHNEAQNSRQEEVLLRYLVFSAVNAREETIADKAMLSGGFSPAKRSQISHSAGQDSVTKTYKSPSGGPLRFALTFSGEGAASSSSFGPRPATCMKSRRARPLSWRRPVLRQASGSTPSPQFGFLMPTFRSASPWGKRSRPVTDGDR